jgi:aminoglycoside 3-N-acetyltransferase
MIISPKTVEKLYNRLALISPGMEILLKKIYWRNIKYLWTIVPKKSKVTGEVVNWEKVLDYLETIGVTNGKLLVMHSSYEAVFSSRIPPGEMIRSIRELLGKDGTLAMPVIRYYNEEPSFEKALKADVSELVCSYYVNSSPIITGVLPFFLTREKDVVISRYPLDTMAAVGKMAEAMMEKNICEDNLTPCGKYSSWAFCAENSAIVLGIGIDLCHSLTIVHVATDLKKEQWPVKNWYRRRIFDIIDTNFRKRISVLEREPKWGCCYLPTLNFRNELLKNNILTSKIVGGVVIEHVNSKNLIDFLEAKNKIGYPYHIPSKYFVKD